MKKVLGLDLGVGSIGWALIEVDNIDNPSRILGMGSRIVPLSTDDTTEFSHGNAISKNQKRTQKRTQRKGYDRYQLRRQNLTEKLRELNMLPDENLIKLPVLELWQLRSDAASEGKKLSLPEIGRVLYHLNQKRGYKHSKSDDSSDSKQREYVANINKRYAEIQELNMTIGQFFASKLKENEIRNEKGVFYTYRIKEQVFPRAAYIAEFDRIMNCQKVFYPNVLTEQVIDELRNNIIYYQRRLKSCKHLVSICEFEKKAYINKDGKIVFDGPKVAPKTSPLFQVCKIWESVNNITLTNKRNETFPITLEQRWKMFEYLDNHDKMSINEMYKILGIKKSDGWWGGKAIGKGIQGNTTKVQLKDALEGIDDMKSLLRFELKHEDVHVVDVNTGEFLSVVSPSFLEEPLYKLWHVVYSIQNPEELKSTLEKQFGIADKTILDRLCRIDFVKPGFGNKSAKFMRKLIPYLEDGEMYSEACEHVGINHSNSITKSQNKERLLLDKLPLLDKNSLRQPVVEKILNQMINVVNALIEKYGEIDEIRVELARELKESREERSVSFSRNNENERKNKEITSRIQEYDVRLSKSRIQKYKLWEESEHRCFYCGQPVGAKEFLEGFGVEVEHVIPRALFFDDSFSNKVCSCRKCNADKKNKTAYDFMKQRTETEFQAYLERVNEAFQSHRISKTKRDRLLTSEKNIPTDFIARQLRESQYIAKKSQEILKQVCRNVWSTSGSVTDFLRHTWGYDEVLHSLNFAKYKEVGLTEQVSYDHKGQEHMEERIKDWSKRLDHRHHAIDALTIAETKQSFIQRLNNLNTERDAMFQEVEAQGGKWQERHSLLEKWTLTQPHFDIALVKEKTDSIIVSYKAGKKVATTSKRCVQKGGKRVVVQQGILVPRGALSEDSVYGSIKTIEKNKPVKFLLENPDLIVKGYIRALVKRRLEENDWNVSLALATLKKTPIFLDKDSTVELQYATCYKQEYVIKYPLTSIKTKDIKYVIDNRVRELIRQRLEQYRNDEKQAYKEPLYYDGNSKIEIHNVRMFTGLNAVVPVKYSSEKEPIGFSKSGNNHHVVIYKDENGMMQEHIVSFWHAVDRKRYGIPVIITNPQEVWDSIIEKQIPEEFLTQLPYIRWEYVMSMQPNEMFVMGLDEVAYQDAISNHDYQTLNKCLYRVQKLAHSDYYFRLHTETNVDDTQQNKDMRNMIRSRSIGNLLSYNPYKVRVSILGEIFEV